MTFFPAPLLEPGRSQQGYTVAALLFSLFLYRRFHQPECARCLLSGFPSGPERRENPKLHNYREGLGGGEGAELVKRTKQLAAQVAGHTGERERAETCLVSVRRDIWVDGYWYQHTINNHKACRSFHAACSVAISSQHSYTDTDQ